MRTRFLREGRVANSVDHPGVVKVVDDDVAEDGSAFLVMELLDGVGLEQLHDALAHALSALPHADPEQLAAHLLGAQHWQRAADQLVRAAERASHELGFDRAARLYSEALEHGSFCPETTYRLRVARADALAAAGRGVVAAQAYELARTTAPASERVDLVLRAAEYALFGGEQGRGMELLRSGAKLRLLLVGGIAVRIFARGLHVACAFLISRVAVRILAGWAHVPLAALGCAGALADHVGELAEDPTRGPPLATHALGDLALYDIEDRIERGCHVVPFLLVTF